MSDEEWAFSDRFILAARAPNGRKPFNHRLVLEGIFWIARTGAPWRDLPEEFGKWSSVYRQFRRWTLAGLWEEIMDALNHCGAVPDALQMIPSHGLFANHCRAADSTVIRAHHPLPGWASRMRSPEREAAGAKGGLRDRVWAVPTHLPLHDRDPPPRQYSGLAHENRNHAGPDVGLSGVRSGHGRQPARAECPAGTLSHMQTCVAGQWTEAMILTAFERRWTRGTCSPLPFRQIALQSPAGQ